MPTFSQIVDRAVFLQCGISVEPLRSWWRNPINDEHTVESLVKDSFADFLVGDGIWQCIIALDHLDWSRRRAEEWLSAAVADVQQTHDVKSDDSPLWLSWFGETAEAIELVRRCATEQLNCCSHDEILLPGVEFIRNGLPSLAVSYWKRARRAARHQTRRERILNERTAFAINEANEFANMLSVRPPVLDGADADMHLAAIISWYDELQDSAILQHFWMDHREYLVRLREIDPSAEVSALIRTAERRSPLTFATLKKLLIMNRNHIERLLQELHSL